MNQTNSIIELSNSFLPEIMQGRVAGKSQKIRCRRNCFLIRAILKVKKSHTCEEGGAHLRVSLLAFIDELEKQITITKIVEVGQ